MSRSSPTTAARRSRSSSRTPGDRPIQIGSHAHFFEVNRALRFDRRAAWGMHLAIPSGTAVRFEPGEERTVWLVTFGGVARVHGLRGLANGRTDLLPDDEPIGPGAARAGDR